jgi:flagellar protein FliS
MSPPTNSQYLDGKVLTASQPRLHLMLLDGTLRFGRQAKELWDEENFSETDQLLGRVADILDEMTRSVSAGSEESSQQLEEQYAFIYRELAACRINLSVEKLDSCLKLLEFERETWLLACERFEAEIAATGTAPKPHLRVPSMPTSEGPISGGPISEGLSLEA